jgi:oligoendopeptidase F
MALMAKWQEATSWFNPELLSIPLETVRGWMADGPQLATYRFAIEEIYRQQEHVLDEHGERLLSLSARLSSASAESYSALSTADAKFAEVTLSTGETVSMSYGRYRAVLATARNQADRRAAFFAHHGPYAANQNTYASLYHGVCQRDWFHARSRGYATTLDAALHANAIPRSVVLNLIETTRAGVEPLRRYHHLRRRALVSIATASTISRFHSSTGTSATRMTRSSRRLSKRSHRWGPPTSSGCGAASASAGSMSTRTTASAAAPIRRRCTACTRTC